jgi:hypothetical protein
VTPKDKVLSLTLETKGSEWGIAAGCPHIALGFLAGSHMVEVGSKIYSAYVQEASTAGGMQDFEYCPADWTGNKQCDRDVLIVVDGSVYDASGVVHILRCCHPRFAPGKKSKIETL